MSINSFEDNKEVMIEGISQILGRSPLPKPTIAPTTTHIHKPDGFIYDETQMYWLYTCSECGEQYEQLKS